MQVQSRLLLLSRLAAGQLGGARLEEELLEAIEHYAEAHPEIDTDVRCDCFEVRRVGRGVWQARSPCPLPVARWAGLCAASAFVGRCCAPGGWSARRVWN